MKKILIIAFGLLVIVSCKKEETPGSTTPVWPDYLVGTWNLDDIEMEITANVPGIPLPITIDAESLTTSGGYTFNTDNTFSFDWESNMALVIPILGPDTMLIEQDGSGTYVVLNDNQIELDQDGAKTLLELKSKSPSLIITEFEDAVMFDTLMVDIDAEAILSK
jgi:hypothetical protein